MQINPSLEHSLEQLCPERLKALLLWFSSGLHYMGTESDRLEALLAEYAESDPLTCYRLLDSLKLQEMVEFTLINEFGPSVAQKQYFPSLVQAVTTRLTTPKN